MKGLAASMIAVAQTTPLGTLLLVFAISAALCALLSFAGWWLEDKFYCSKWEDVITFPFIMLGFATWLVAAMSLLELLIATASRLF